MVRTARAPANNWGPSFAVIFDQALVPAHKQLVADPTDRGGKVEFVTTYHLVIEATLGLTAFEFITRYLNDNQLLAGFVDGYSHIHHDEQRHIGYGVWFLREAAAHDETMAERIRAKLIELLPAVATALAPPDSEDADWEALGATGDEVRKYALDGLTRRLNIMGVPLTNEWRSASPAFIHDGLARKAAHRVAWLELRAVATQQVVLRARLFLCLRMWCTPMASAPALTNITLVTSAALLAYVASAILIAWGSAHLAPTRTVAASFGTISADNRRILVMERMAEGITHISIGLLVILATHCGRRRPNDAARLRRLGRGPRGARRPHCRDRSPHTRDLVSHLARSS